MKVSDCKTFRMPITEARHSGGTAEANKALKPTLNPHMGMPITRVITVSAQICPWFPKSQGRGIHRKYPNRESKAVQKTAFPTGRFCSQFPVGMDKKQANHCGHRPQKANLKTTCTQTGSINVQEIYSAPAQNSKPRNIEI